MKKLFYIFLLSILMSSCATIMNSRQMKISVYTSEPSEIIYRKDTTVTIENKVDLIIDRNKEPITLVAVSDSLSKSVTVQSRNSFMYWSNIYCNWGLGMLVDMKNPKRYSYPRRLYLNLADTLNEYYQYDPSHHKGDVAIHLSLPYINSFQLTPKGESDKVNTGFWGLTIGLDYFHSTNQYLNLGFSGVMDFFIPFPAAVDFSGEYELMSSTYISLSNNHRIGRFSLGYGLAFAKNTWNLTYHDRFDPPAPTRDPVKKSNNALGFVFPVYFQIGEYFNLGIVYRPTFYRPGLPDKFEYEHLISIDFAWKIRLKK